jgi:hypothetical protein
MYQRVLGSLGCLSIATLFCVSARSSEMATTALVARRSLC